MRRQLRCVLNVLNVMNVMDVMDVMDLINVRQIGYEKCEVHGAAPFGSRFASEQRTTYTVQTKAVTRQVADERLRDAISIGEMRSFGKLQLLSSVMKNPRLVNRNPCAMHEPPMPSETANTLPCANTRKPQAIAQKTEVQRQIQSANEKRCKTAKQVNRIKRCREMRVI